MTIFWSVFRLRRLLMLLIDLVGMVSINGRDTKIGGRRANNGDAP
jgi:hypothetical protein